MTTLAEKLDVSLLDMVLCLTRAIDLLHPAVSEHHLRVACVGACLAAELGLDAGGARDVMIAGALHDLAAVSSPAGVGLFDDALTTDRLDLYRGADEISRHGFEGYLMLRDFPLFAEAARIIRFHHVDWRHGAGERANGHPVPLGSHILRLADRVAILPDAAGDVLEQAAAIRRAIGADAGRLFHPDVAAAFEAASHKEAFWLDLTSRHKEDLLRRRFGQTTVPLDLDGLHGLARVFGKIIDYRSAFTATHSSGVAATSEHLAARLGLAPAEQRLIGVAGYLHDIGKLAVPPALLDKPGKLTPQEMLIIKRHPYHTHQILSMVPSLATVNTWASLHHERLDGTGYPFRTGDIPLQARIIAVADVFTAITEHRPYRAGMPRDECLAVLDKMVAERAIDGDIVAALRRDFEQIHHVRGRSQQDGATPLTRLARAATPA